MSRYMRGPSHRPPPPPPPPVQPQRIDREKTCPLLLRVFTKDGRHHDHTEFQGKEPVNDEFQIHTWKDCTLRELTDLLKEACESARASNVRFSFSLVYPDQRGIPKMRPVGQVHATRNGPDDAQSLEQMFHQTGDFMDVAILQS
eukprot:gnl/Trimastix_PCT/5029.p1 GENE.gnl/Trimastix_PCT/5029~~gnl/Trimastix_PCT/5029.p1  ORF type:complete len:144 (+),score=19.86 gnl/Trimastix_PCT/5029:90-521(+)